jgi:hypothetical protein
MKTKKHHLVVDPRTNVWRDSILHGLKMHWDVLIKHQEVKAAFALHRRTAIFTRMLKHIHVVAALVLSLTCPLSNRPSKLPNDVFVCILRVCILTLCVQSDHFMATFDPQDPSCHGSFSDHNVQYFHIR